MRQLPGNPSHDIVLRLKRAMDQLERQKMAIVRAYDAKLHALAASISIVIQLDLTSEDGDVTLSDIVRPDLADIMDYFPLTENPDNQSTFEITQALIDAPTRRDQIKELYRQVRRPLNVYEVATFLWDNGFHKARSRDNVYGGLQALIREDNSFVYLHGGLFTLSEELGEVLFGGLRSKGELERIWREAGLFDAEDEE